MCVWGVHIGVSVCRGVYVDMCGVCIGVGVCVWRRVCVSVCRGVYGDLGVYVCRGVSVYVGGYM